MSYEEGKKIENAITEHIMYALEDLFKDIIVLRNVQIVQSERVS